MNFTGMPIQYSPIIHTDADGTPIEQEKKHTLSQGWIQSFNALNNIIIGNWEKSYKVCSDASLNKVNISPYGVNLYLEFNESKSDVKLTFPIPVSGLIHRYNSFNALVETYRISGLSFEVPTVNSGDVLTGVLVVG